MMLMKKLLLLSLLLLNDCACSSKIALKGVTLEVPNTIAGLSSLADREKLSILIKRDIGENPHFFVDANKADGSILKLTFVPPKESQAQTVLLVGSIGQDQRAFANIKVEKGESSGQFITEALEKVLAQLYQQQKGQKASKKDVEKITAGLKGEIGAAELLQAISSAGLSKDMNAVKPLTELLLSTSDISLANAALSTLGTLKAQEAMPAIIDFMERKPAVIRRQGIMVAQKIGSKLAMEWLLVMAYGHEDEIVRREALAAFTELERQLSQ